ncbi:MAG TPA: LPS export ABC transporter periplasmic protein LptC [Longimicrobiales bacterium]|nr:LPS export ABC transporter periplasmic protein LptC [Longimicrobiales bacterium]
MRTRIPTLLLVFAMIGACDAASSPPTGEYESLPADQVITNIDHLFTSDGVRRAQLRADTAYVFRDSTSTRMRGVTLEMYDNQGGLTSTLTADSGQYNTKTQKTVARGNVVLIIEDPDGRTIWTEELHYDPVAKRVWSEVPTRMLMNSGEDFHVEGFTADDQFRNVETVGGSGTGLRLPVSSQ